MSGHKLHADDTPVPVLASGAGKTKLGDCGRTREAACWAHVRCKLFDLLRHTLRRLRRKPSNESVSYTAIGNAIRGPLAR
jgi:hypothetical protein